MIKTFLFTTFFLSLFFLACKKENDDQQFSYGTVTDIEGNSYRTIKIGTQTWMADNLRSTKFNDGTIISYMINVSNSEFLTSTTPLYCWNFNDSITYKDKFGALYNWYAVNTGKLAPAGWHIPTDEEWTILSTYLGGESTSGSKLKEIGEENWRGPNSDATNQVGFNALPGGIRQNENSYNAFGWDTYFWSTTADIEDFAFDREIFFDQTRLFRNSPHKCEGISVRCVKDSE